VHPLVIRFLKGVFESRPAMPVLDYLNSLSPVNEFSLKSLTLKFTILLHCSSSHCSKGTIPSFSHMDSMIDSGSSIVFRLRDRAC